MKIGVLIPTRGDRPQMLDFAFRQLDRQTRKPDVIEIMDDAPVGTGKDITWRYRIGCERILAKGVDVVFLIEDDDYYDANYIKLMMDEWEKANRPEIFGIGETSYYHLGLRSYYHQQHFERASAFSTMITPSGIMNMKWPKDDYSFTDIEFWKQLKGKTFIPFGTVALGIKGHKHGSLFGGIGHKDTWSGYRQKDPTLDWLRSHVDRDAFEFYKNIAVLIK
jgi:hypothetical protein